MISAETGTVLRLAQDGDGAAFAAIYRPIVLDTWISFETEPPTAAEMDRRVAASAPMFPWLTAEIDGRVAGYAYASAHQTRPAYRWSVNVSVYLDESARGRGAGRRLYEALLAILRLQGFRSAFAGIALPNAASVALHEGVGFRPLGAHQDVGYKLGAWRSVGWWRLGLSETDGPPDEPAPLTALVGTPALEERLRRASP